MMAFDMDQARSLWQLDNVEEHIAGAPAELLSVIGFITIGLLLVGLPIFLIELWCNYKESKLGGQRIKGMLTSIFCLVPATVVEAIFAGALIALYFVVGSFAPWTIATGWVAAVMCFVLVDFLYYWEHRLGHEVNFLWSAYHSVHHSAGHYDQTIGLRVSFVDFFFSPLIYLPLVLLGFNPVLVLSCFGLLLAWQQWIHTELVGKMPLLDTWLNTPSNHRVHHGRNKQYLDRNYGGVLIIWDRIFGTYEPEVQIVDYGLVEPLTKSNPIAVHFHVFGQLLRDIKASSSFRHALKILFGKPGQHNSQRREK